MTLYSKFSDQELEKATREHATAQRKMAGDCNEDRTHWHHVGLSELLTELANRLASHEQAESTKVNL
jgi:hypothetical protein